MYMLELLWIVVCYKIFFMSYAVEFGVSLVLMGFGFVLLLFIWLGFFVFVFFLFKKKNSAVTFYVSDTLSPSHCDVSKY